MWISAAECGQQLAEFAVAALVEEAELSPKPGLVDSRSSGSHSNMDISLMRASAISLFDCFEEIGKSAYGCNPSQELREELARLGRSGERRMMTVTQGVNTHRGAIWALGLLIAGCAILSVPTCAEEIAAISACIAKYEDRYAPSNQTNGMDVMRKYGIQGAKWEAMQGFPHVVRVGLPTLEEMRGRGIPEELARIHTLLAIMAHLPDTCLLHRGGTVALETAQLGARHVLQSGGLITKSGQEAYRILEHNLLQLRVSPGGSADMLGSVLFLDKVLSKTRMVNKKEGVFNNRAVNI